MDPREKQTQTNDVFSSNRSIQPSSGQLPPAGQIPGAYGQPGPSRSKRKFIIILIAVLILMAGLGAYLLFDKKDSIPTKQTPGTADSQIEESELVEQKTVTIPESWKTVKTELGPTVRIPDEWVITPPIDLTYKSMMTRSISLRTPDDSVPILAVDMAIKSLSNSKSQTDFSKAIKEAFITANALPASTVGTKAKATISRLNINGKEWTKFLVEFPSGQVSNTIYLWDNDHAIELNVIADDKQSLDKKTNDYLLPVAASII
ncbi:MAG TPA: hypothetical protein VFX86_02485 [Candidatus Saccharimonadales bacterium]|nr:hypothetical protein [Candidatus Saccharimonadales bacterium]